MHVLIVEDEAGLFSLQQGLEEEGYTVSAADGSLALRKSKENFDLILLIGCCQNDRFRTL
jgi:DNA-binding response OmpR family regulator